MWCICVVVTQGGAATDLGVLSPSTSIAWVPAFGSSAVTPALPSLAANAASSVVPSVASLLAVSTVTAGFPVGSYLGEGLLPIPDKLA